LRLCRPLPSLRWGVGRERAARTRVGLAENRARPASQGRAPPHAIRSDAPSICGRTSGSACLSRPIFCAFAPFPGQDDEDLRDLVRGKAWREPPGRGLLPRPADPRLAVHRRPASVANVGLRQNAPQREQTNFLTLPSSSAPSRRPCVAPGNSVRRRSAPSPGGGGSWASGFSRGSSI
jgi:hypothetical protein